MIVKKADLFMLIIPLNKYYFVELNNLTIVGELPNGFEVKDTVYAVDEELQYAICKDNIFKLKEADKIWASKCSTKIMNKVPFFESDEFYEFFRFLSSTPEATFSRT